MAIVFNLIIIGLVLIIAYWWANQGLLSALLHLMCVLVGGAVAFGLWEVLVVRFFLRGGWFDHYAWGITLVMTFAVTVLILRVACDKLAPANLDVPHWASLVFGFPLGGAAGIVSLGVVLIGCGFMQSHSEIMGYRGYGPDDRGRVVKYSGGLWFPVHQITGELYGWLSVTSMPAPMNMRQHNPLLHRQASLVRASFRDGTGQITLPPDAAEVRDFRMSGPPGQAAVSMHFMAGSLDFGEQLTISASQVRLISEARGRRAAEVVHPAKWVQEGTTFLFDDRTHYITSRPGQEHADATIIFDLPADFMPRYIQIKGTRFRLPRPEALGGDEAASVPLASTSTGGVTVPPGGNVLGEDDIKVSNTIRPIRVSKNQMPGGMKIEGNDFVEGFGTFHSASPGQISRALLMTGVYESPGTKIVTLDVSRGAPADIYNRDVHDRAGAGSQIRLVDAEGNSYSAIGFLHERGEGQIDLKLVPGRFLRTFEELPYLPTSGEQKLRLFFRVTAGAKIVAFMYGDVTVGRAELEVAKN